MKLHLPTALFALAVLPAVAAPEFIIDDYKEQYHEITKEDYTTADGHIQVKVGKTGTGMVVEPNANNVSIIKSGLTLEAGDSITVEATPAKILYIDGDLSLSDGATATMQGTHSGQCFKTGIAAQDVFIGNSSEMVLDAAQFSSLTVNGGTVKIHMEHDNGGSFYGSGYDISGTMNGAGALGGNFEFSNASISNGLTVKGAKAEVELGRQGYNSGHLSYLGNFADGSGRFQSTIGGFIEQSGGVLKLHGMTYLATESIRQTGGEMFIATEGTGNNGSHSSYLRIGTDRVTVSQENGTLNLQGVIVKGTSGTEALQLIVEQTGDGEINLQTLEKRVVGSTSTGGNIGSYFTSELGKESLISQSGSGQVNIGSDYKSATFNVEQKGEGSVTLKEHGVLRSSVVSINDKSTFKIDGGKLMLNEGAQLNLTVGTGSVGLQVANGGSITSASADSTVVVNVLLTEDAMKSNITLDQLATLLDGTNNSLTFSVNIAQFGDSEAAEAFAGMLTMSGNEQVLTYTPDAVTFSGEGAVSTDLAISVTGFTSTGGMVQAQVSATRYTAPVPEPTTATLSLLALAGLCARRRRK